MASGTAAVFVHANGSSGGGASGRDLRGAWGVRRAAEHGVYRGRQLAHTVLPGLVAAYLLGLNLLGGAVVATALGIGWLSRRGTVREDTAIGIAFTGMFALGVLLMSTADSFRDFSHMLFGNILGITRVDVVLIGVLAFVVLVVLFMFHKELELTSFDPAHAKAMGLSPDTVRYGLLILLSLTVVAGIQAVGVVLISALLITPAAAASLLTRSLPRMMAISAAIAEVSGIVGLYASYYLDVASGAAIVLACTTCFIVASAIRALRQNSASSVPEPLADER